MSVAVPRSGGRATATIPGSWLVAAVATVGMLAGLLVLTADLGVTADTLHRGVGDMGQLVATTATAAGSAGALAPSQAALDRSSVAVTGMVGSLTGAVGALDRMSTDLGRVAASLGAADQPLAGALGATGLTGVATGDTQAALDRTAASLAQADQTGRALGPLLDETNARAAAIERKLRVLRLIPS